MISGKTGEKVIVTGLYTCEDHPDIQNHLIEKDDFPHCSLKNNHKTNWELKEKENEEKKLSKENINEKDIDEEEIDKEAVNDEHQYNLLKITDAAVTYKKKGFYAAMNNKKFPDLTEFELMTIIQSETAIAKKHADDIEAKHNEKVDIIKMRFENLKVLLKEKSDIKTEFEGELDKMQIEFDTLTKEINGYYTQLRNEVRSLGTFKEDLISKRIAEFDKEITRVIDTYQNIEKKQNDKFRSDFINRDLKQSEKDFYINYRKKLELSFNDVQGRIRALEKDGLNYTIARFLIALGWISAITSSWFFELCYSDETSKSSSGLFVYIFDNLRNFVVQRPAWISVLVFLVFIAGVMFIAKYCYETSIKYQFIKPKDQQTSNNEEGDKIEFNLDKEGLIKTQFKANSWYEMWLKMAPFVFMVLFLVVILALGAKKDDTYENLSKSVYLQMIGLLLPVSFTAIIFLYITKVIETKVIDEQGGTGVIKEDYKKYFNWRLLISIVFFLVFIAAILIYQFKIPSLEAIKVPVWGFFAGCACTGLALAYGYRFISLNESFDLLVDRLHIVNQYIERVFYPFEASYLKHNGIIYRMRVLYHTLLTLLESRNNTAIKLLNPNSFARSDSNSEFKDDFNADKSKPRKESDESLKGKRKSGFGLFLDNLVAFFQHQLNRLKTKLKEKEYKIKDLEDKIAEFNKDTVEVEELIYFPEAAAKIKEFRSLIDERTKRLTELKDELDGYFKNEKTYASLNQQIQNIVKEREKLAGNIEVMELDIIYTKERITEELKIKLNFVKEGYNIGLWYSKKYPEL